MQTINLSLCALVALCTIAHADESLRQRARALPDVVAGLIDSAVDAAIAEATDEADAPLLLSLAWGESRMDPTVRTGIVCGVLQVNPADLGEPRSACGLWTRDLRAGFAAGVREIHVMLGDRRVRHDLRLALLYRACGNKAFDGTCSETKHHWVSSALVRARYLRGTTIKTRVPVS